ncbi:hypothetical protein DPMN_078641 [Dreissena polymorpha]|uniref:Uncharacterized protein n=1 Tax=Dreissena polymorpha TaxID=45954 RepID=A0A9D3YN29_DREPO|nr:hypothetical protein DPMN_078641 [Dreissena polymorpha]
MASTSETSVELKIPPSPAIPERDDTGQSSETQLTTHGRSSRSHLFLAMHE